MVGDVPPGAPWSAPPRAPQGFARVPWPGMWRFRRKDAKRNAGGTARARPARQPDEFDGSDELRTEIERLTERNRAQPDRVTDRRLLRLRHLAGMRLVDAMW